MRPFFSYYGAKYTVAKYAGPPRRGLVIEPFAGSAAYSTRYTPRRVALYDISEDICALWDWLIHCSEFDVRMIPDYFNNFDEVERLPHGAKTLVRFWIAKGRAEPSGALSPWYFRYRGDINCRVWGPSVKERVIKQKPHITEWTCENLPYWKVPMREAHWHVDPPYNNKAGARYPFSNIDYNHLAEWCKKLPGTIDVFDNEGATWLPFSPLCSVVSTRGRRNGAVSKEAIFSRSDFPWETRTAATYRQK